MKKSKHQAKADLRRMLETLQEYEQEERPVTSMARFAKQFKSSEEYLIEARKLGYLERNPKFENRRGRTFWRLTVNQIKQSHVEEIYNAVSWKKRKHKQPDLVDHSPEIPHKMKPDDMTEMAIKRQPQQKQGILNFNGRGDLKQCSNDRLFKLLDEILDEMKRRGFHGTLTTQNKREF